VLLSFGRFGPVMDNGRVSAEPAATSELVNEHAWQAPAPGLRKYVDSYVGYRQAGAEPALHRGLPSPSMTLIFTLDEPLVMAAHPDPAQPPGIFPTLVGGLHSAPALISHDGRQAGVQLALSPLGARVLLGVPAGELAGFDLGAEELLGPLAAQIRDRLHGADSWPERFAILDTALLARLGMADRADGISAETGYAWRRLLDTRGLAPVRELAAETGWSERHLRARFQQQVGLAPKAAARVIRFDNARRELQRRAAAGRSLALADLAASFGYFDQAHLDREFGLLAGCPPTRWVAEEFRNFQAADV
jgi:AraC-like DNA-binding protein